MSSETQNLENFVKDALRRTGKPEVKALLIEAGWPQEQVTSALNAFADVDFSIAVPKPRPSLSAREAFLYLVLFSTLYLSAYHLGSLVFDIINKFFPDPIIQGYRSNLKESMRWSISFLIIAFPVFLFISNYIGRLLVKNPVKRLSPVRRWLTYLTLFITSSVLIGDLTTLVYNVLGGELTIRFGLKVATAAIIAGTTFVYYLRDLRKEEIES